MLEGSFVVVHVLFSLLLLAVSACGAPSSLATTKEEDAAVTDLDSTLKPEEDASAYMDSGGLKDAGVAKDAAVAGSGGGGAGGSGGAGGAAGKAGSGGGGAGGKAGSGGAAGSAGGGGNAGSAGGGSGGGAAPECVTGATECDDLDVLTCSSSGTWQTTNTCPYVCADGACTGSCVPGAKQCSNLNAQTCNELGVWVTDQACPYVCSGGSCAGSCVPGATKCTGLTVQTCDASGVWQNAASACQYACSAGACSGTCQPTATRCSGTSSLDAQTCNSSGTWQTTQTCPYVCNGGSCSGACTPGARQCNGTVSQLCNSSGQWTTDQTCPYVCSGAGSCSGSCVPGSMQCSGLGAQTCDSAGAWQTSATCPYACSSGNCIGVCVPGSTRCSGASTQTCGSTGQWQTAVACPSRANAAATCSGAGQCGFTCNANFADCNTTAADGCEVNLQSDSNNCNACGRECCGDGACSAGTCRPAVAVAGDWLRFDMDATNFYTASTSDPATIKKTPRAGGPTTTFVTSANTKGNVWVLLADGTNLYWTSYETAGGYLDVHSIPAGGGAIVDVTSGKSVHNIIHDATDLFWSYNGPYGIEWKSLTSSASGITTFPANTYWMVSTGQYLYYEEANTTNNSCGGTAQSAQWTSTLKRVPVHGGATPELLDSGCGQFSDLAIVGSDLYYVRSHSGDYLVDGRYTVALAGGQPPIKVNYGGSSMVNDGTDLYYCNQYLTKKPLSGGAEVNLTTSNDGQCMRDVKVSGECVYYNSGAIMTVNKTP